MQGIRVYYQYKAMRAATRQDALEDRYNHQRACETTAPQTEANMLNTSTESFDGRMFIEEGGFRLWCDSPTYTLTFTRIDVAL
jgi:hypothetical protein